MSNLDKLLFDVWVKKAFRGLLLMLAGLVGALCSYSFATHAALADMTVYITIYLGFAYFSWTVTFVGSIYILIYAYKIFKFKWRLTHARV